MRVNVSHVTSSLLFMLLSLPRHKNALRLLPCCVSLRCATRSTLCLKKHPDIFDCNVKKNYPILIILARIFPTQLAIK